MKHKKLKNRIVALEARVLELENPVQNIRVIGFHQLHNMVDENEFDYE